MAEPISVSVRINYVRLKEDVIFGPGGVGYEAAKRAGRAAVRYVQDEIIRFDAVESGELYNSIDYEIFRSGKGVSVVVGPSGSDRLQRYARYVHDGTTGPITADGKLMPVQIKGGPLLFLRSVKGQKAKPYVTNAMRKLKSEDFRK